ncbi:MAG: hypothetical protein ACYTG5_08590 [Planctomycetota bacterium]|jgi:hypothetical protein
MSLERSMPSTGELFDHLLGEGDASRRAELRRQVADSPEAALEMAELGLMLESMRAEARQTAAAECGQVSPGLSLSIRYAIQRRSKLREAEPLSIKRELIRMAQVAAMMLLLLSLVQTLQILAPPPVAPAVSIPNGSLALAQPISSGPRVEREDPALSQLLDVNILPVADASFLRSLEQYSAYRLPDDAASWMHAENLLSSLREEHQLRSSLAQRRQFLALRGSPDLGDRVESLATDIAARAQAGEGLGLVVSNSLILRALLAADPNALEGSQGPLLRERSRQLVQALPSLSGGNLARALAALNNLAVMQGGEMSELVGEHADRLAREVLRQGQSAGPGSERPELLSWRTPVAALADAGQVLKLAPAFGVHSGLAFRARLMVAAHLGERMEMSEREFPDIRAAQLYGFGDLVDRAEADRKLRLWRARMLLPDYEALFQLAWSKYPARSGWAQFQRELRGLAAAPTPSSIDDASALLLCLSSNFAAPGSLGVVQLTAMDFVTESGD